jgi:hypothetical protein
VGLRASVVYHDSFWYPLKAKALMRDVLASPWGRLFRGWETAVADDSGYPQFGSDPAEIERTGLRALDAIGGYSWHLPQGSA